MSTLGIIHGGAQNEPRTSTFYLSRNDYNSLGDMGQFNTYRYVNATNIIEEGRRLYYLGGKPAGEILQPGYSVHGHLNFGTTYKTLTYFATDHADTIDQYITQLPNQSPLQLWGNPNIVPYPGGGNGIGVPHPVYEIHNVTSDITGVGDWNTMRYRCLFKYSNDNETGRIDPLCNNGDNYIVYNDNKFYSVTIRCFGFYGLKAPFPILNT